MEKEPAEKIRITIAPKGNMSKSKTVKVTNDAKLKDLFTLAKQKWKGKWNMYHFYIFRCTLKDGIAISDENIKSALYEDVVLIFSHVEKDSITAKTEETKVIIPHEPTVMQIRYNRKRKSRRG